MRRYVGRSKPPAAVEPVVEVARWVALRVQIPENAMCAAGQSTVLRPSPPQEALCENPILHDRMERTEYANGLWCKVIVHDVPFHVIGKGSGDRKGRAS